MSARDLKYHPPWREVVPGGQLGPEYGPKTPEAFSKKIAEHDDWSQRLPKYGEILHKYVEAHPDNVPHGELAAYTSVFCDGYSERNAAALLGISRSTVKTQIKRLRAKAVAWLLANAEEKR